MRRTYAVTGIRAASRAGAYDSAGASANCGSICFAVARWKRWLILSVESIAAQVSDLVGNRAEVNGLYRQPPKF